MKNTAFVLPPKLAEKVEQLKQEMGYDDPGAVITRAIELLDLSLGRKVILREKNRDLHIDDLADYKPTFNVDDNGSTT